jgi:hypothetical protein
MARLSVCRSRSDRRKSPSGPVSRIPSPRGVGGKPHGPRTPARARDHSSGPEVSLGIKQPTRRQPTCRGTGRAPSAPLFGLAPHGVYRAPSVAVGAVRSYRTVSPLPSSSKEAEGGLFSVALSFASPRPGITRHAARVEFGLSSPKVSGRSRGPLGPGLFYHSRRDRRVKAQGVTSPSPPGRGPG